MKQLLRDLPQAPGVYLLYSESGELIYIGKSVNLKQRLLQHAQGRDRKSQKIQQQAARIEYRLTGSNLIAELYEADLIKQYQPRLNRALRKTKLPWALVLRWRAQYLGLAVEPIQRQQAETQMESPASEASGALRDGQLVSALASKREGERILRAIGKKYFLCNKINGLEGAGGACFNWQLKRCFGACLQREPAEEYNARVQYFLAAQQLPSVSGWLELPGRTANEKGLVLLEGGVYRGFGFCGRRVLQKNYYRYLQPAQETRDSRRILRRYFLQQSLPQPASAAQLLDD